MFPCAPGSPGPPGFIAVFWGPMLCSKTVCSTNPIFKNRMFYKPYAMLCYAMFKNCMFYKPYAMFKNRMFYKPYAIFKNGMFYKPYVPKPYVLQTLCYAMLCSKTVCSTNPMLCSKTVCSTNPMFHKSCVQQKQFLRKHLVPPPGQTAVGGTPTHTGGFDC